MTECCFVRSSSNTLAQLLSDQAVISVCPATSVMKDDEHDTRLQSAADAPL